MGIAFLIILGAVLGWLAGLISGSESKRAIFFTIIAGIASALVSGLLLPPLFGQAPLVIDGTYQASSVTIAFVGSFLLLALTIIIMRLRF